MGTTLSFFQEGENRYLDLPLVRAQRNTFSRRARRGRRQELHGELIALPAFYHCQLHGDAISIRAVPQDLERALIAIHNGDDALLRLGFPPKRAKKNGRARQHLDRAAHAALDAERQPRSLGIVAMDDDVPLDDAAQRRRVDL